MAMTQRRRLTASDKVGMLNRHLLEDVPVSDCMRKTPVATDPVLPVQKRLFEGAVVCFESHGKTRGPSAAQETIAALEATLTRRNAMLAELLEKLHELKHLPSSALAS